MSEQASGQSAPPMATAPGVGSGVGSGGGPDTPADWVVVARVVFPVDGDEDVLPLYVDYSSGALAPGPPVESGNRIVRALTRARRDAVGAQLAGAGAGRTMTHLSDISSRHSASFPPDSRVSFGTYFNGFPAGYWRHWTDARTVRLHVEAHGGGSVVVYRSNARGLSQRVALHQVDGEAVVDLDLTLAPFIDGGWYWFDLISGSTGIRLVAADWSVPGPAPAYGKLSLGTTTFNRARFCVATLAAIADDAELREHLEAFYVVDQGTDKVSAQPEFADLTARLGDQLQVIDQPNLGGSGGFSRGMYESVRAGRAAFHMCIDDDIYVETEGILRALRFAWFTRTPTIVGGHMFDLYNRSVLHAWGESIDWVPFLWGPNPDLPLDVNLAVHNVRQTGWMHRRHDVEYNGWWMCLIPTQIIREIGLAVPVFIKWDDAEYALRAREAGYATVSLPGAAVWHVSWGDKDDGTDWGAYFHARNRLLTALLHSPHPHGGRIVQESAFAQAKHALSMQYYTQAVRQRAITDLMSGPAHLHAGMGSILGELRAAMREFPDTTFESDPSAFPAPAGRRPAHDQLIPSVVGLGPWLARTAVHHLKAVPPQAGERPDVSLPNAMGRWWTLPAYDSLLLTRADGSGVAWLRRDRDRFLAQSRDDVRLHRELWARWADLASAYRAALPELTSFAAWEKTFGIEPDRQDEPGDREEQVGPDSRDG